MDRIREQILETARQEAAAALKAVREETQARIDAARQRTQRDLDHRLNRDLADVERDRQQALDRLAFEHRLDLLKRKTEIIEQVFRRAAERFTDSLRYREWLDRRLVSVADLTGEVLCNVRDRAACRAAIDRLGRQGQVHLNLAREAAEISGGLIVRTERFDLDLSLEAAFKDLRARVMPDLIALAFSALDDGGGSGTS